MVAIGRVVHRRVHRSAGSRNTRHHRYRPERAGALAGSDALSLGSDPMDRRQPDRRWRGGPDRLIPPVRRRSRPRRPGSPHPSRPPAIPAPAQYRRRWTSLPASGLSGHPACPLAMAAAAGLVVNLLVALEPHAADHGSVDRADRLLLAAIAITTFSRIRVTADRSGLTRPLRVPRVAPHLGAPTPHRHRPSR